MNEKFLTPLSLNQEFKGVVSANFNETHEKLPISFQNCDPNSLYIVSSSAYKTSLYLAKCLSFVEDRYDVSQRVEQDIIRLVSELKHDWKKIAVRIARIHRISKSPDEIRNIWMRVRGTKPPKTKTFTKEEDERLRKIVSNSQKLDWLKFTELFPLRSPLNLKNRYYYLLKRNFFKKEQLPKSETPNCVENQNRETKQNKNDSSQAFGFKRSYDLNTLVSEIEVSMMDCRS